MRSGAAASIALLNRLILTLSGHRIAAEGMQFLGGGTAVLFP